MENLRLLIDPAVPHNSCQFSNTEDQQVTDLFLRKTEEKFYNVEMTLYSRMLVIYNTDVIFSC